MTWRLACSASHGLACNIESTYVKCRRDALQTPVWQGKAGEPDDGSRPGSRSPRSICVIDAQIQCPSTYYKNSLHKYLHRVLLRMCACVMDAITSEKCWKCSSDVLPTGSSATCRKFSEGQRRPGSFP